MENKLIKHNIEVYIKKGHEKPSSDAEGITGNTEDGIVRIDEIEGNLIQFSLESEDVSVFSSINMDSLLLAEIVRQASPENTIIILEQIVKKLNRFKTALEALNF